MPIQTEVRPTLAVPPGSLILVTGASGYIGSRLVGELLEAGYGVRCVVRAPAKLSAAPWVDRVDIVRGDVLGDLSEAMAGVAAVYYLVHTIGASKDWVARDHRAAKNVREQAAAAAVHRIVYLGGLGDSTNEKLSSHLASRHEVGRVLADGPVPVTELRAAVIIGAGSVSFEMVRYLVEVLPVMVTPRWVQTRCQPIAVRDVLRYLVGVLAETQAAARIYEIGGPDVVSYRDMMNVYAQVAGLHRRWFIPVPVLTPSLSSHWVGFVTPLPASLARPLVDSLINEVIVHDDAMTRLLPGPLLTYRGAVSAALGGVGLQDGAGKVALEQPPRQATSDAMPTDPAWSGGTQFTYRRDRHVHAVPSTVYGAIHAAIAEELGRYRGAWLWTVRSLIDRLSGGSERRRSGHRSTTVQVGDTADLGRVEALEPNSLVRLRIDMRLPGEGWLEWSIEPERNGSRLRQTARFRPRGLSGRLYWLAVSPFHRIAFSGLLDGIAEDAEGAETPVED